MFLSGIAQRLPQLWYQRPLAAVLLPLLPISWLFALLAALRRWLYRCGALSAQRLAVPVVVVGNITVGGSGKTPLVLWLAAALRAQGRRPGIISRGYGGAAGSAGDGARAVFPDSLASEVGDEPLLLARRSGVPVFVGRDRVASGQALLVAHPECDLIISDDGLQHYRLHRDFEIVLFDGRGAGNACLLPAGPLREPLPRLRSAGALVWNGTPDTQVQRALQAAPAVAQFSMRLLGERFVALGEEIGTGTARTCSAADLQGKRLYALAGIGDPSRFFRQLTALGLSFTPQPFADHHAYCAEDLAFAQGGVLLMTEKDAVKCAALPLGEAWVLPVAAQIDAADTGLLEIILEKIDGRTPA